MSKIYYDRRFLTTAKHGPPLQAWPQHVIHRLQTFISIHKLEAAHLDWFLSPKPPGGRLGCSGKVVIVNFITLPREPLFFPSTHGTRAAATHPTHPMGVSLLLFSLPGASPRVAQSLGGAIMFSHPNAHMGVFVRRK